MTGAAARALSRSLASACLLVVLSACPAHAVEGAPLSFTHFTMQATEGTREESLGGEKFEFVNEPYKTPFTQAGGHPWGLTTSGEFQTKLTKTGIAVPTRDAKDIVTTLPPGLLGDPMAVPRCSLTQVLNSSEQCPADTQVGVYRLHDLGGKQYLAPIVNVTPEAGQSAEFALENTTKIITPVLTAHLVRTAEGYSFAVISNEIPLVGLTSFELTFWGVPGDSSHDAMRGRICRLANPATESQLKCEGGGQPFGYSPVLPFLSMPTDCSAGPETATARADSWQEPGVVGVNQQYEGYTQASTLFPAVTGCNLLQFKAGTGIALEPDTEVADEPVGLGVALKVGLDERPGSDIAPLLRHTAVTLPEGMSISPGVVDGIRACDAFGPEGINITGLESEQIGPSGELQLAPGHCPEASIVGSAEAITPFLPTPVKGHVYLARPGCGGSGQPRCTRQDVVDGNLYKLYLELGGTGQLSDTGIEFKVPLETEVDPATGQLTAHAHELVQAPYSEVKIRLNGGPRAPIDTPSECGGATASAEFTPWSASGRTPPPESLFVTGTPAVLSRSSFDVIGCSNPEPLHPALVAGISPAQAGRYGSFTMELSRQDREQYVRGIQLHTPPGLLGVLASVPLCGEPQADDGRCGEASKIGTARVASGAGSHPFEIEGNVYLTGPYAGVPFGLSIVTHVVAGPFDLGLVVVRARIAVDRHTSELTITTDEDTPYAIPQIVFGVPVRLRRVTVDIDRPNFMFNPTNCSALRVVARVSGMEGADAVVSSPFAVAGCRNLAFKPKFAVSTSGRTSRSKGASLDAKLSYPAGSLGREANIARVRVSLPRQLPSRLTTLQKACPSEIFEADPAACRAGSVVGIARARTQLLPVGLSGPAYFVSHGGEAFPSLVIVLQGDGVRVDLIGTTFISKRGITSTTFKATPDVPVRTFELYLPQGRNSALAANGNLCRSAAKLKMPTEFVAQNGATIKRSTQIVVTGCKRGKQGKRGRR